MKTISFFSLLAGLLFALDLPAQISGQVVDLYLNRYNSAPTGAKLTVNDGEILGTMHFRGWTPGNEYQSSTAIRTYVTGMPAPGFLPGRMAFYTGGTDLFTHERMTILENGFIGIGLSNPAELLDINGNTIVRGTTLSLGLGSAFADGGEALTHTSTNALTGLPGDVLTINSGGGFAGGVFVDCPGLRVCGTLETECLKTEKNFIANKGNILAFGDAAPAMDCDTPGDGDFIAYGSTGDFIAKQGNVIAELGNVQALAGSVFAGQDVTAQNGNIRTLSGEVSANLNVVSITGDVRAANGRVIAEQNVVSVNGHLLAPNGNAVANNVSASTGDVEASQNVRALLGDVSSDFGNVTAGQNVTASQNVIAGNDVFASGNARIGVSAVNMPAGYRVAVAGKVICEEVRVALQADWPDYVFEEGYPLPSTEDWELFIKANGHLPGLPNAVQVAEEGIALGDMQARLLEKIEELTLIVIEQQKQIEALKAARY